MAKAQNIAGIDCQATAVDAIRTVLTARLAEMCSLRDRALNWNDPEGVHDMRVSSRRLRGALSDFAPYLRRRALSKSLKEIKKLADALGTVRDQDVAIMGLQKLTAGAPEQASATLDHFIRARDLIRKRARVDLRTAMNKRGLTNLQQEFELALDSAIAKKGSRKRKARQNASYVAVTCSIVSKRLKELESLSDSFYHPLKVKPLHRMRIAAKHLRYAIELSEQCLGPTTSMFARKVAALQTSLGELHDADIWIETFGEQLETAKRESAKDRVAGSLWLLSHFVRLHSKHLRTALAQWEDWETQDLSSQLRELLSANVLEPPITRPKEPPTTTTEEQSTSEARQKPAIASKEQPTTRAKEQRAIAPKQELTTEAKKQPAT